MKLRQTLQDHQDSEPISASDSGTVLSSRTYPDVQATVDNSPRVIAQSKTLHSVIGNEQPAAPVPESIAEETSRIANVRSAPIQLTRTGKSFAIPILGAISSFTKFVTNYGKQKGFNKKPKKPLESNELFKTKYNTLKRNTPKRNFWSSIKQTQQRYFTSSSKKYLSNKFQDNPSETDPSSIPKEKNKEDVNKNYKAKLKPLTNRLEKKDKKFPEEGHPNETEGLNDRIRAALEQFSAISLHDQSGDKEVCLASTPQNSTESESQDHRTREPVPNTKIPAPGDADFIGPLPPCHSRYADRTPVFEGLQPSKVSGPLSEAPHSVIKWDYKNKRVYKAREYGLNGVPIRDIDFTNPTFRNGTLRPDHYTPEQHRYIPNDPNNPKAGYKRGPGEPLRMP
ncbi:hypothetical protein [Chitinimonas taiwanensis]|uniref:hypothetical protein n=1 Tax=Chitinimonas taiwanensis TaxID=240412 RepID=UPI0035B368D0